MNYKAVGYLLGKIYIIVGALMLLPLFVLMYYSINGFPEADFMSFVIPILIFEMFGFLLTLKKPVDFDIHAKEGFVVCGLGWLTMSALGALPFVISGCIPSYIDAFFETVSGFTTTGASILNKVSLLPKSILFWRTFTHWIGGMGILSFMIAVVPKAKGNSMFVMRAEVPGPSAGKIVSKIAESARILYIIYLAMTVIEIFVLFVGSKISGDNIRFFDCVVNALATAGTGGFSVLNNSIAGYHSAFTEWTLIVFMFLFGVNFNLYYFILTRKISNVFKDGELKAYIFMNIASVILITSNICSSYNSFSTALRDAFFSVNSVMSTTGFCTADFNMWPTFSKAILLMLMCVGGCAGSTGGGFKVIRISILFKQMLANFRQMLRPNSVVNVRMNDKTVHKNIIKGVNSYLNAYIINIVISVVLLSLNNFDFTTTFSAVISCINNIGPGLELVGPIGNYAQFSVLSKLVLIYDMLAGRLELFPIILLFSPNTWRKTR